MRNLKITFFFLFSYLMACCCGSDTSKQQGTIIPININNAKSFIPEDESQIITPNKCSITQLKCPLEIGTIENMKFDDDMTIILGSDRQRLYVVNQSGECESKIFHLGKASNEYVEITDYYAINGSVYILDMSSLKVLEFNYKGECKGITYISDYWANSLFVIGNHIFLVNDGSDTKYGKYHIFEITKDGTLVKSYLSFDNKPGLVSEKCYATYSKDTIFYAQRETNTIFKISNGTCEPFITLDFGKYNLPTEYKMMDARELVMNTQKKYREYALGIESIYVSGNLLFVKFMVCGNNYLLVINHENKKIIQFCRGISINSMYHIGLMNYYLHKSYIYDVYDSDDFLTIVNELKENVVEKPFLNQLKETMECIQNGNENPILIRYELNNE